MEILTKALAEIPRAQQDLREFVRARALVRQLGRDRVCDALRSALRPWSGTFEVSAWDSGRGHFSTFGGTPSRPNPYVRRWCVSPSELRDRLQRNAQRVRAKGTGLCLTHARVAATGGSTDEEVIERTALFCDADVRGEPDGLVDALRRAGAAFVLSRKVRDSSFHAVIPYAAPLATIPGPAFKQTYRVRMGVLLGLFSEMGELACEWVGVGSPKLLGFDIATARRLGTLEYAYNKREPNDALPLFEANEGLALDPHAWLEALGWTAEPEPLRARREPAVFYDGPTQPNTWLPALESAGMLLQRRATGGRFCVCPLEHEHTEGPRNPTATFVSSAGVLWCSRGGGHLRGRYREARAAMPSHVQHFFTENQR